MDVNSRLGALGALPQKQQQRYSILGPRTGMEVMVKVKVKLSPCLAKHLDMKTYWGWRYNSTNS